MFTFDGGRSHSEALTSVNKSGKSRAHNQQYLPLVTGGYAYTRALMCGLGSVWSGTGRFGGNDGQQGQGR